MGTSCPGGTAVSSPCVDAWDHELLIDAAFTLADGTPIGFDVAGGALTFGPR